MFKQINWNLISIHKITTYIEEEQEEDVLHLIVRSVGIRIGIIHEYVSRHHIV